MRDMGDPYLTMTYATGPHYLNPCKERTVCSERAKNKNDSRIRLEVGDHEKPME